MDGLYFLYNYDLVISGAGKLFGTITNYSIHFLHALKGEGGREIAQIIHLNLLWSRTGNVVVLSDVFETLTLTMP